MSPLRKKALLLFIVCCTSLFSVTYTAFGQEATATPTPDPTTTPAPSTEKLNDLKNQIADLESKLSAAQSKEKSLSSEIAVLDNQIKLTELRIDATNEEIDELTKDINSATGRIDKLEGSLDDITKILINRVVATYQIGSIEPLEVLVASDDMTDFFHRANYLKVAQENDKKLMYSTVQAKNDYEHQKNIFEDKKTKIESLKTQLESYTQQIEKDKTAKNDLLQVTKNDEKKYQDLLAIARSERSAIEGAYALKLENGTPVKQGDPIATVGNSGAPYCSTGAHLHFTVRKNGSLENPGNYLRSGVNFSYSYDASQFDYYGTVSPSGSWDWPLSEPVMINQGYGSHGYARAFYSNGLHDGWDMVSNGSSTIKAPKDGTLYRGATSCRGASMNYVAVEHSDGVVTWYFHVQ
jgi:peptidoglycan hydrolase CwlO-like protein